MNFLIGFAGWAFHRHHNIAFVGHNLSLRATKFTTRKEEGSDMRGCSQPLPGVCMSETNLAPRAFRRVNSRLKNRRVDRTALCYPA
jgi:hypothetical protein